MISIDGLKSN